MNGNRILNSLLAGLLLLGILMFPGHTPGSNSGPGRSIAILLSEDIEAYNKPARAFEKEVGFPVHFFNLRGEVKNAKSVMDGILSKKPSLIYALGAKASYVAKVYTKDKPGINVVFAMVLNWQRYKLTEGQDNIAGVEYNVAPGTQFINMTMISPDIRRIGVIFSKKHSEETISRARRDAEMLGLELVTSPIRQPKHFKFAFKKMENKIDGFWIVADPGIFTIDNMYWLNERCLKNNIACIGQTRNVTEKGALMAVEPDIAAVGSQSASLAKQILTGNKSPRKIGVKFPIGTRLVLNEKTANGLGLEINEFVKGSISEIITK